MSNPSDIGTAEEEKKTNDLLALLYPDDGVQVDADLYADDDELAGMLTMRALFKDALEHEPSDAVSNKLLALAAQHAPAVKSESRGLVAWFSDMLMPLVAHPGLAAAATLVLLIGVAGTLYVKGDAKVAEPHAPSRGAEPTGTATADQPMEQLAPVQEEAASLAEAANLERSAERGDKSGEVTDKTRKADPAVIGGVLGASARGKGGKKLSAESNSDHFEFATEAPGSGGGDAKDEASKAESFKIKDIDTRDFSAAQSQGITTSSADSKAPSAEPAPPPPAQKKPAPVKPAQTQASRSAPAEDDDSAAGAAEKEQARSATAAASLHAQARTAAKKNDCARVQALGQQIRKLDSAYYDRSFLSDASLKSCREAAVKKSTISK